MKALAFIPTYVGIIAKAMRQDMKKIVVLWFCLFLATPIYSFGQFGGFSEQFGKNKVVWRGEILNNFYQSEHFDVWHSLELKDSNQQKFFEGMVSILESAYLSLSFLFDHEIQEKIPVVLYKTHSEFENTNIIMEFLPEGVGAFVENEKNRMVLKADFSLPLMKSIVVHELAHSFQFSMLRRGLLSRVMSMISLPRGFLEGGAEFIASLYVPHTRDDLRRLSQRIDAGNPELFLPTWEMLRNDQADPYAQWEMVFEFLEERYGAGIKFQIAGLKEKNKSLGQLIEELAAGSIKNPDENPESFDRAHRDFWGDKFAESMRKSQRPYETTQSFKGKNITPENFPYGILSFDISPDGKEIAFISFQNNGLSILVSSLKNEDEAKEKTKKEESIEKIQQSKNISKIRNITPNFPPTNFEYIVSQRGNTWPFSGSDIAWHPTERKIAFFARKDRDHKLFLANADKENDFEEINIPYDQAFSPSFSLDGKKIYFSASENLSRSIYELDFETRAFRNLTNNSGFYTAPAVSPDGKKIAYIAFEVDFQKLFLLDLETMEKRQLTFNRHNDDSPSFTSDHTLIYLSDKRNGAWNICEIDIDTMEVKEWTEFFGGAFSPKVISNTEREVAAIVFWPYDQFRSQIYKNLELYRLNLLTPLNVYAMENKGESMIYSFQPFYAIGSQLDKNQIKNPIKSPKRWSSGAGGSVGFSNYWGAFGYGAFSASDIKENNIYNAGFLFSGSTFRLIDFAYLNRERRLGWGYGFYDHQLPLNYLHWDFQKGYPKQFVLNYTFGKETGGGAFVQYPLSKFSRVEAAFGLEKRDFEVWIEDEIITDLPEIFTDVDRQFFNFFKNSSGFNASFTGSYVRDTVLYSNIVQGPIHGNAFRMDFEVAPPLGFKNGKGYSSFSVDYRRYKRISNGSLFAFRFAGLRSSRATGDYVLLGGDSTLRAYPYGFVAGNQIIYGSAEIRFPFVDAIVFPNGFAIGSFRGFLFADYAYAKFSAEKFSAQEGVSMGPGISLGGFNFVWAWRKIDGFKNSKKDFYISKGWNF